ncbi:uncharacterized protein LOC101895469 [Musca domestica]|uniref:Uncharacterized protein LOC101895469 n=2 Tax=Musca domestica TaxID=7370 RepID=A0A9J7I0I4_MUSDO|nr:uncharacterized protein LOC101895469 [Musca domestica]
MKVRERMPVAVRLVEVLTLVTLLGILTGFSIFIVIAQRLVFLLLLLLTPLTFVIHCLLSISEKILVGSLTGLLSVTNNVGGHNVD